MARKGFYVNIDRCTGCRTCQVACKDVNDLEVGLNFRRVATFEVGSYPNARMYHLPMGCNHCNTPACTAVCPTGAMYVDEEDGTVQHDDNKCIGCESCAKACPYGVPQFVEELGKVHKCDACIKLRAKGEQPACVASCTMRALEFGDVEELKKKHPGAVDKIAAIAGPELTQPTTLYNVKPAALEPNCRQVVL